MRFQCLSEEIAAAPVPMDVTPSQRMLSACAGVLATSVVVTPMDVVKTRVQAVQAADVSRQTASYRYGLGGYEPCPQCVHPGRPYTTSARAASATLAGFDGAATSAVRTTLEAAVGAANSRERMPALPSGTFAALTHIARWEGPRGLYRGLDASLVMAIPATVLYYTVYDDFLARLENAGAGKLAAPATAGSSARLLATLVMAPLELVRTRAQSYAGSAVGTAAAVARGATRPGRGVSLLGDIPLVGPVGRDLAKVFQQEGMAALWRGVGTTMWRDVPFSMVYWLGYENLKVGLGCGRKMVEPGARGSASAGGGRVTVELAEERGSADFLLRSLVAGAISGMVASLLTNPFDVVKTQRQVLVVETCPEPGCERPPPKAPGTFEVMRSIVETRGPAGLFTGAMARVGKVAPACAIMMISYEAGKRFFGERNAAAAAAAAAAAPETSTRGR